MRTISRGNSTVNMVTKWMSLLLSLVVLGLAGCGDNEEFYGETTGASAGGDATATYIGIKASPNLVGTGAESVITATFYDQYGAGVSDVTATFSTGSTNGGSFPVPVSTSGSNGEASITYTAGTQGGVTEKITVNGGGLSATVDVGVQTVVPPISSLALSINPPLPLITAGSTGIDVEVAVKDSDGSGVPDQTVSLIIVGDGSFAGSSFTQVTTGNQGTQTAALTSPTLLDTGSATITAQVLTSSGTLTQTLDLSFTTDVASTISQLWATPSSIGIQDTTLIQARVRDKYGNLIAGESVTFTTTTGGATASTSPSFTDEASGFTAPTLTVKTDSLGIASVKYNSDASAPGTDNVVAAITAESKNIDIVLTAVSTSIGDIVVSSLRPTLTADGADSTRVTAFVSDTSGAPMEGETVNFTSSAGTITATAVTDANGDAIATLTASTSVTTSNIKAVVGGLSNFASVDFVPGPIAKGVITAIPSSLPADGTATSTVTVALQDALNNPVADGTAVTLYQELAGITDAQIGSASASTSGGRASFTITAATSSGSDTIYLSQLPTLTYTMNYGVGTTAGEPASIEVLSDASQISVQGVGENETATVTVKVKDGTGAPVANEVYNNVRVTMIARPNAGEFISGTTDPVTPLPDSGTTIDIFTNGGETTFGIQSGVLPGVVEIRIDVLDANGTEISGVTAIAQVVIASGPAHSITLTAPYVDSVINVGGGVYKRIGTALVADRYGNAVADGTVVNLGILDTVIAQDTAGSTLASSTTMTDTDGASLNADTVIRNSSTRRIEPFDRVLFTNAAAEDKSRHVSSDPVAANSLTVNKPYINGASSLNYVIGASTLSAEIFGVDHAVTGLEVKGYGTTVDGKVSLYVQYPANAQTILVGCGLGGWACTIPKYKTDLPGVGCTDNGGAWIQYYDERYVPNTSAEVYVVASTSEAATESAVTVDQGQFCFAGIAGGSLVSSHDKLSGDAKVTLSLSEKNKIPLPFVPISANVIVEKSSTGSCSDPTYTTQAGCEATNGVWTVSGTCTDTQYTDPFVCTANTETWTDTSSCDDGVSATQVLCETPQGTWTSVPLVDTTNISCITDNPGTFVAGQGVTGSCTASVVIGNNAQKDDKATIVWHGGGGSVAVPLVIP